MKVLLVDDHVVDDKSEIQTPRFEAMVGDTTEDENRNVKEETKIYQIRDFVEFPVANSRSHGEKFDVDCVVTSGITKATMWAAVNRTSYDRNHYTDFTDSNGNNPFEHCSMYQGKEPKFSEISANAFSGIFAEPHCKSTPKSEGYHIFVRCSRLNGNVDIGINSNLLQPKLTLKLTDSNTKDMYNIVVRDIIVRDMIFGDTITIA